MFSIQENTPFYFTKDLLAQSVFLGIDIQRLYCKKNFHLIESARKMPIIRASKETQKTAFRTALFAPKFRSLGLDIAWVYNTETLSKAFNNEDFFRQLYAIRAHKNDALIPKNTDSALDPQFCKGSKTALKKYLEENDKTVLFVSGVNLNACVYQTVKDALEMGYHVVLINDLCGDDQICQTTFERVNLHTKDERIDHFKQSIDHVSNARLAMRQEEDKKHLPKIVRLHSGILNELPEGYAFLTQICANDLLSALHNFAMPKETPKNARALNTLKRKLP